MSVHNSSEQNEDIQRLWKSSYSDVRRFVVSRLPPQLQRQTDADDVLQETYVAVCNHPDKVAALSQAEANRWLIGIAKNKLVDRIRMATAKKRNVPGDEVSTDCLQSIPALQRTPSSFVANDEAKQCLRAAMKSLSEQHSHAIELRFFRHLSYAKIAESLEISVPAAHMLVKRAVKRLRQELGSPSRLF